VGEGVDGAVGDEVAGAPSHRREIERLFWCEIAKGLLAEAARAVGVSQAVGGRWFRHGGGMPSINLAPLSGRYLSFREREEIGILNRRRRRCPRDCAAACSRSFDDLA
jgi:hypothetical protein